MAPLGFYAPESCALNASRCLTVVPRCLRQQEPRTCLVQRGWATLGTLAHLVVYCPDTILTKKEGA